MKDEKNLHEQAKQMIIDGESFDTIMEKTHLRLKDLKRIQRNVSVKEFTYRNEILVMLK